MTVTASWGEHEASASIGGCSYESEADFRACRYFDDLKAEALENLNTAISDLYESIRPLGESQEA